MSGVPKTAISQIMDQKLSPPGSKIVVEISSEFLKAVSHEGSLLQKERKLKSYTVDLVYESLERLGYGHYIDSIRERVESMREEQKTKNKKKSMKKQKVKSLMDDFTTEELIKQQNALLKK